MELLWFFYFDVIFPYPSCLAVGLFIGNNKTRAGSHGTRKGGRGFRLS